MSDPAPKPPAAPGRRGVAILAACALVLPLTLASEGLVTRARPDPVGVPTGCYGHTEGVVNGQVYTPDQCLEFAMADLLKHGSAIDRCIGRPIPLKLRAAFSDFAFNMGSGAYCRSTLARKVNAGDLAGACAELSRWTRAGGRELPGLVIRRAKERALCEQGLNDEAAP